MLHKADERRPVPVRDVKWRFRIKAELCFRFKVEVPSEATMRWEVDDATAVTFKMFGLGTEDLSWSSITHHVHPLHAEHDRSKRSFVIDVVVGGIQGGLDWVSILRAHQQGRREWQIRATYPS